MASGQPKGAAQRAVFASGSMPPRIDDELASLDRCVSAYRDVSIASLSALTDASGHGSAPHSGSGGEAGLAELQSKISTLQTSFQEIKEENVRFQEENRRIQQQMQDLEKLNAQLQKSPSAQKFQEEVQRRDEGIRELTERCRQLQTDLSDSQAAKAKAEAELAKQQAVLPQSSSAGNNGHTSRAVTPTSSFGGGKPAGIPPEVIEDLKSKLAVLKQDQQELEDGMVNMYQTLFSSEIVSGLIRVLRRKENELIADAGAGAKGGGGKGAPLKLRKKLDDATTRIEELETQLMQRKDEAGATQRHYEDMVKIQKLESEAQIKHFQTAWKTEMEKRKSLHQKVLELKGAIRVFCRVRPLVASDGDAINCIEIKDQENLVVHVPQDERQHARSSSAPIGRRNMSLPPERRTATGRECAFEFDRVFGPEDTQEAVYEDVSDLVVSAADGYNVCIIAYGQTGSGKTYTMMGSEKAPGINMRALKELFSIGETRSETMTMTFSASILEIYNESIFDLLASAPRDSAAKLDIKETNGHIWIPSLIRTPVKSVTDVEALIGKGDTNRSTFATDMNEHSSRSHLILSLYIAATNKLTNEKTASKLHLIDLAGSERVSKSHAEGARLREAQSINSSLSQLGDVIQRLKSNDAHVPYRNCSLTRLLSDSLGGASKTLLVVNLSPSKESAPESRSSCDFASRAKKVELGRATRQVTHDNDASKSPGNARPVSVGPSARMHRARHSHTDVSALRTSRSVSGTNALPSPTMR